MIEQITHAFDRQDYKTTARLVKQLLQQDPDNPWGKLYAAKLHEVNQKPELAEKIYRHLLRQANQSKIITQARTGLQRIAETEKQRRKLAIAEAVANPENTKSGVLILEPVTGQTRQQIVQSYARLMNLDAYTAQRQLPSRHWRLLRMGPIGELQVYGQDLLNAGIPTFWVTLAEVEAIEVFQVLYIESLTPQVTIVCQNTDQQLGSLTFDWTEIKQRVDGRLPIFESVIDLDARGRQQREERTQDYTQICDLHLPGRNCILRFCDSTYDFLQGIAVVPSDIPAAQLSNRISWNHLIEILTTHTPNLPIWSDFTAFADMVLQEAQALTNPVELLGGITPHIPISRREESNWDSAFQLYSGLTFLKTKYALGS